MNSAYMEPTDSVPLYPVKLVFREITGDALSLYSINDFYTTSRRLCEESFVVSAPKSSAVFIVNRIDGKVEPIVLFVIEVSELLSIDSLRLTLNRLKRLARSYDLELLGTLDKGVMTQEEEREEILEWIQSDAEKS